MYEELLKSVDCEAARIRAAREAIAQLPELEGICGQMYFMDKLVLIMPHNFEWLRENEHRLTESGWEYKPALGGIVHETGSTILVFRKDGFELNLQLNPYREGATCKITRIGTQTFERPIYEVTCVDA